VLSTCTWELVHLGKEIQHLQESMLPTVCLTVLLGKGCDTFTEVTHYYFLSIENMPYQIHLEYISMLVRSSYISMLGYRYKKEKTVL
jgi:hypothetical protein